MKIKNLLYNTIFILAPILSQSTDLDQIESNPPTVKGNSLFLNTPHNEVDENKLTAAMIQRRKIRQIQVDQNLPEFTNYIDQTIQTIENYTTYTDQRKSEIKKWLTQEYVNLPKFDQEAHRLNILEKCVYINPNNENQCWECIEGWGPYPVTPSNWQCKACNQTIDNC
jgi:hypothetical protein